MKISIDASELRGLAADLTKAGSGIADKVRPVVHRGAGNIARQMTDDILASNHFKGIVLKGGRVDYDMAGTSGRMVFGVGVIEATIGPRTGPGALPGDLYHVAVFGNSRGGGTVPDPQTALDAEAPRFEKALGDILGDIL